MLIFGLILFIVGAVADTLFRRNAARLRDAEVPVGPFRGVSITASVVGAVLFMCSSFTVVPAGHRGVMTLFGEVRPTALTEGFHVINPLLSVTTMTARAQRDTQTYECETSDTQTVKLTISMILQPQGDALPKLFKQYGTDYGSVVVPPAGRETVKAEVAKYKVTELVANRPQIHASIHEKLTAWLSRYDITVLEVSVAGIDFSKKYDDAIEAKQVQEQAALQKQYELQRTKTEAEMAAATAKGEADSRIAKASGDAEAVKLAAQAEAEALRIRGEAQADFNRRVSESLSPLLIQSTLLQKWDGKLPVLAPGSGASPMMVLPAEVLK